MVSSCPQAYYFDKFLGDEETEKNENAGVAARVAAYESPLDFRSPMGFSFYLSITNNMFAIFGLAGVINAQVCACVCSRVCSCALVCVGWGGGLLCAGVRWGGWGFRHK